MIKFGTDGWRGVISDDFTFANVRVMAQALSDYLAGQSPGGTVLVGYDTRFLSEDYALEISQVLAANGYTARLTEKPVATPVLSFAVKNNEACAGVMVTASHNPYKYNGVKIKAPFGGSASPEVTGAIEECLHKNPVKIKKDSAIDLFNPDQDYLAHLKTLVDLELLRKSGLKIVIDPMFGSSRGYLKTFLQERGINAVEIRSELNPLFGGVHPEPIPPHLNLLSSVVSSCGKDVGLACDGDGDRVGAVTTNGDFVNPHVILALLLKHLAENKGWRGMVVKTFSTTRMMEILAQKYNLPLAETPVGFKHIAARFQEDDVLIGGEESGGIGFKNHIIERDGILSGLLLLEAMAWNKKSLSEMIGDLMQETGPHFYQRMDLTLSGKLKEAAAHRLKAPPPLKFAGIKITSIQNLDGLKFNLANGGWILFRLSGTEPLLRIYVEAPSPQQVQEIISAGRDFVS